MGRVPNDEHTTVTTGKKCAHVKIDTVAYLLDRLTEIFSLERSRTQIVNNNNRFHCRVMCFDRG